MECREKERMSLRITCEKSTELSVRKADGKIGLINRLKLWFHLRMCALCRNFERQNAWIDARMKQLKMSKLSQQQKREIKERLKKNMRPEL